MSGVHKNNKLLYYLHAAGMKMTPPALLQRRRRQLDEWFCRLPEERQQQLEARVDYCCRTHLPQQKEAGYLYVKECDTPKATVGAYHFERPSSYYYDLYEYVRYFDAGATFRYMMGDVVDLFEEPTLVKTRPVCPRPEENSNSVLMKLDKARHFLFVDDPVTTTDKQPRILFRGYVDVRENRQLFMRLFANHPLVDAKDVVPNVKQRHDPNRLTLRQQLNYRYIMALEGKDVASNLKWIMSSNSLAVMPQPRYESWFMEGTLVPDYHYVAVAPDFSDLMDRVAYYEAHPQEAQAIVEHAHEYVRRFRDKNAEDWTSLAVLKKYFSEAKN